MRCDAIDIQIPKGTKLTLPFWLTESLHAQGFVSLYPPRAFGAAFKDLIEVHTDRERETERERERAAAHYRIMQH
jgi:hypothetical protein